MTKNAVRFKRRFFELLALFLGVLTTTNNNWKTLKTTHCKKCRCGCVFEWLFSSVITSHFIVTACRICSFHVFMFWLQEFPRFSFQFLPKKMDPKRLASISCLFVLCQNFTLLKENEDCTRFDRVSVAQKTTCGQPRKKMYARKNEEQLLSSPRVSLKKSTCSCTATWLGLMCASVFVSALFFYLTISFQFQTTNKGFSKTQQRQKTVSSGAEVRRRAHSRLLPCKVHATPQGTGYVPQALQNRCSEGTQFFFITYIFTKSVAASFGKGSQTLRDESLRCARSSAWGRPRRCNPEVKDLHHHHHHRHH